MVKEQALGGRAKVKMKSFGGRGWSSSLSLGKASWRWNIGEEQREVEGERNRGGKIKYL